MAQWSPQQLQQMAAMLQGTHNQLAVDNALAGAPTQRWAVDAQGQRVDPYGTNPAAAAIDQVAQRASPQPSPVMAYGRPQPAPQQFQNNAPVPVNRVTGSIGINPLFGTPAGSIFSMLGGGKFQMPQTGGLMGLMAKIFSGQSSRPPSSHVGDGSVAAMERWHGGGSSNPQSGGPAVGGSYGGS